MNKDGLVTIVANMDATGSSRMDGTWNAVLVFFYENGHKGVFR